jgi:hypothetical protein
MGQQLRSRSIRLELLFLLFQDKRKRENEKKETIAINKQALNKIQQPPCNKKAEGTPLIPDS